MLLVLALPSVIYAGPNIIRHRRNAALIAAVTYKRDADALALLKAGADANFREEDAPSSTAERLRFTLYGQPADTDRNTALILLLRQTDVYHNPPDQVPSLELFRELLKRGANPNGMVGGSLPMVAVASNLPDPVYLQLMLEHGGNVNGADKTGMTPLMVAAMWHNEPAIKLLIEHGADVNHRDRAGITALQYLTSGGPRFRKPEHFEMLCDMLLAHGANIDTADGEGKTPLMRAAEDGSLANIKALLARHARTDLKTVKGKTALDMAGNMRGTPAEIKAITALLMDAANRQRLQK